MNGQWRRPLRTCAILLACLLACIPAYLMAWYVLRSGGANFQDDYAAYIPHLTRMWNEGVTLGRVLDGSPHGPHFTAIPLLLRAWWMTAGHWDAFTEAGLSLLLGVLRVGLVYLIFARLLPTLAARMTMLLTTSFMIFAPVQVGLFAYGDTGLTMGFDSLGFLLGLWGAVHFPRTWKGVTLIIVGGGISAWAWGMAITWIVLFAGALGLKFSRAQLVTIILGAVCIHAPMVQYVDYFIVSSGSKHAFFNFRMIVGALGRPFTPDVANIADYPLANYLGLAGALLAIALAVIAARTWTREKAIPTWAIPGVAMMAWVVLYLYQISLARTGIGAWYVSLSVYFWIGLAGLCLQLGSSVAHAIPRRPATVAGYALVAAMAGFYVPANLSFDNKTPFLQSRSLSADACQRHYLTAPTYCEMMVFFWPPVYEFSRFSRFFAETELAGFGSRQRWTMQGDFVLQNVWFKDNPDYPQSKWIRGMDHESRPVSWKTHERLNLYLPIGQQALWRVRLPANTTTASFKTKVHNRGVALAVLALRVRTAGAHTDAMQQFSVRPGQAVDIDLDASDWKGEEVTIEFEGLGGGPQGLVLTYPRIDVRIHRSPHATVSAYENQVYGRPENTDLSPVESAPNTIDDAVLEGKKRVRWDSLYENPWTPVAGAVCVGDYQALKVTAAIPEAATLRFFYVLISTRAPNGNYFEDRLQLPVLSDDAPHTYTVDLKLLPMVKSDRIESIRLYPLLDTAAPASLAVPVEFSEIRLVRSNVAKTFCAH